MPQRQFLLAALTVLLSLTPAAAQQQSFLSVDDDPDSDGPVTVEYTPDGAWVLIPHYQSNDVTFLDPAAQSVVDAVAVGAGPLDLKIASHGLLAVTADYLGDSLTVISIPTRQVLGTVSLSGTKPYQVELTSDGWTAVVGLAGDGPGTSSVSVVDLQNLIELRNFPVVNQPDLGLLWNDPMWPDVDAVLPRYPRFDLAPDDLTLVLPFNKGQRLRLYNFRKGKTKGNLVLGMNPIAVQVSPDGSFVAVVDAGSFNTTVLRVDLPTLALHGPFWVYGGFWTPIDLLVTNDTIIVGTPQAVGFLDAATGSLTEASGGAQDLALSHDGRSLIGAFEYGVQVYDVASRSLAAEFPLTGQRVAASPVTNQAVVLERRTAEAVHLIEVNGAASLPLATISTGMPEEGDAPVALALAEEAGLVLTANALSHNVAVVDVVTGQLLRLIPLPGRPTLLAVDPAASVAVVATDSELYVIDPQAGGVLATLPVKAPWSVSISEDGSEAYALWHGFTHLWIIELAGAASQIVESIPIPGFKKGGRPWKQEMVKTSEGLLALIRTIPDQLLLYDLPAREFSAQLDTSFPAAFVALAPDGKHAYLASTDSFGTRLIGKMPIVANGSLSQPSRNLKLAADWLGVSQDNRTLYALTERVDLADLLTVVDTNSMKVLATMPVPGDAWQIELVGPFLLVATRDGKLHRYRAAGVDTALVDVLDLGDYPRDMLVSNELRAALTAQPGRRDGIDLIRYGGSAESYCGPANLNSTGGSAVIAAGGWMVAGLGVDLELEVTGVPPDKIGYFMVSDGQDFVPFVSGSQGNLCLGGSIGRFVDQLVNSGPAGRLAALIDTSALPFDPQIGVQSGETWNFQAWFRDVNPGPTSNMSNAVAVTFE